MQHPYCCMPNIKHMHKRTKILIISLFILNIVIQSLVNKYLLDDDKNGFSMNHSAIVQKYNAQGNNADTLELLADINFKLDTLNQYLANNASTQKNEILTDIKPHTVKLDINDLRDIKDNLMSNMGRYDMNIAMFLTDPRLNSLPEQDKYEMLTELTRRLDSGEIDKTTFLPGYKPK